MDNFVRIDQQLTAWIDAHRDEILERTQDLLRIPSVEGPPAPDAPFGREVRRALDYALGIAADHGLTVRNIDGYAGHAEWRGDGVLPESGIVGILAHVDVVPPGDGWKHDPFGAEVDNGKIYARGAMDDKGPAMASLFAMVAIKECGVPLSKRLRLILGTAEESGGDFECVKHYFEVEEMPAIGFTPDAMFPLVYAEKGISTIQLVRPLGAFGGLAPIVELRGGLRDNMVPDRAEAIIEMSEDLWPTIKARLGSIDRITTEVVGGGAQLRITAQGVSGHGSTPDEGVNAIVVLLDALLLLEQLPETDDWMRTVRDWGKDTTGGALGIAGADDVVGPLTSNLGVATIDDGQIRLAINIRYPVTWTWESLKSRIDSGIAASGFSLASFSNAAPLYVPKDDPLVTTLLQVYRAETGDDTEIRTMGGGTYARVMDKGVAFGPCFPFADESDGGPHEADECWRVEHLILAAKIYAKALARLGNQ